MEPLTEGTILEGTVNRITNFGVFIMLPNGQCGMVHISEISNSFVTDINSYVKLGDVVKVMVLSTDVQGRISLSMRRLESPPPVKSTPVPSNYENKKNAPDSPLSFEDMMARFMKESEEKLTDYKRNLGKRNGSHTRRN